MSTAQTLERLMPGQSATITLVTDANFLLYTPLLPGACGGTLEPRHVIVPLREELTRTRLRLARVTGADLDRRLLHAVRDDGRRDDIPYDRLILALGAVSRVLPVPGLIEHAVGFKTLMDAIHLRNKVVLNLERAEISDDPSERRALLTFVVVGAGYAGVEGIAELQDFAANVIELYPRCRLDGMRWILVEARDRILPEIDEGLAQFATVELHLRGIEILTDTTLRKVTGDAVDLSTGERVLTRTVVWTAGVTPSPVVRRLGLLLDEAGRLRTDENLRVEGEAHIWAVGDAAAVADPADSGRMCPPTAQHAIRQGRNAARNVAASLGSGRQRPFRYRSRGVFVDMGRTRAVASTMGVRWRGRTAWVLARSYHMAMMPGAKRKLRLAADWAVDLGFSRDASELGQVSGVASLEGLSASDDRETSPTEGVRRA